MMAKERDALSSGNDELLRELQLYKSVAVPPDLRPRSAMIRVARVPLANNSLNTGASLRSKGSGIPTNSGGKALDNRLEIDYREGDMALDEIS